MKGARDLTDDEIRLIASSFGGKYATRDKSLFLLGMWISELLSLNVGDVWRFDHPVDIVELR